MRTTGTGLALTTVRRGAGFFILLPHFYDACVVVRRLCLVAATPCDTAHGGGRLCLVAVTSCNVVHWEAVLDFAVLRWRHAMRRMGEQYCLVVATPVTHVVRGGADVERSSVSACNTHSRDRPCPYVGEALGGGFILLPCFYDVCVVVRRIYLVAVTPCDAAHGRAGVVLLC